jgi:hypothetical protein
VKGDERGMRCERKVMRDERDVRERRCERKEM